MTIVSSISALTLLLTALLVAWLKAPPTLIEKWKELRNYIAANDIDDSHSIYDQGYFNAPEWIAKYRIQSSH